MPPYEKTASQWLDELLRQKRIYISHAGQYNIILASYSAAQRQEKKGYARNLQNSIESSVRKGTEAQQKLAATSQDVKQKLDQNQLSEGMSFHFDTFLLDCNNGPPQMPVAASRDFRSERMPPPTGPVAQFIQPSMPAPPVYAGQSPYYIRGQPFPPAGGLGLSGIYPGPSPRSDPVITPELHLYGDNRQVYTQGPSGLPGHDVAPYSTQSGLSAHFNQPATPPFSHHGSYDHTYPQGMPELPAHGAQRLEHDIVLGNAHNTPLPGRRMPSDHFRSSSGDNPALFATQRQTTQRQATATPTNDSVNLSHVNAHPRAPLPDISRLHSNYNPISSNWESLQPPQPSHDYHIYRPPGEIEWLHRQRMARYAASRHGYDAVPPNNPSGQSVQQPTAKSLVPIVGKQLLQTNTRQPHPSALSRDTEAVCMAPEVQQTRGQVMPAPVVQSRPNIHQPSPSLGNHSTDEDEPAKRASSVRTATKRHRRSSRRSSPAKATLDSFKEIDQSPSPRPPHSRERQRQAKVRKHRSRQHSMGTERPEKRARTAITPTERPNRLLRNIRQDKMPQEHFEGLDRHSSPRRPPSPGVDDDNDSELFHQCSSSDKGSESDSLHHIINIDDTDHSSEDDASSTDDSEEAPRNSKRDKTRASCSDDQLPAQQRRDDDSDSDSEFEDQQLDGNDSASSPSSQASHASDSTFLPSSEASREDIEDPLEDLFEDDRPFTVHGNHTGAVAKRIAKRTTIQLRELPSLNHAVELVTGILLRKKAILFDEIACGADTVDACKMNLIRAHADVLTRSIRDIGRKSQGGEKIDPAVSTIDDLDDFHLNVPDIVCPSMGVPPDPFAHNLAGYLAHVESRERTAADRPRLSVLLKCKKHDVELNFKRYQRLLAFIQAPDGILQEMLADDASARHWHGSHRCHYPQCVDHIVTEKGSANRNRDSCITKARKDEAMGLPIHQECTRHNPPCMLQHAVLSHQEMAFHGWMIWNGYRSFGQIPHDRYGSVEPGVTVALAFKTREIGPDGSMVAVKKHALDITAEGLRFRTNDKLIIDTTVPTGVDESPRLFTKPTLALVTRSEQAAAVSPELRNGNNLSSHASASKDFPGDRTMWIANAQRELSFVMKYQPGLRVMNQQAEPPGKDCTEGIHCHMCHSSWFKDCPLKTQPSHPYYELAAMRAGIRAHWPAVLDHILFSHHEFPVESKAKYFRAILSENAGLEHSFRSYVGKKVDRSMWDEIMAAFVGGTVPKIFARSNHRFSNPATLDVQQWLARNYGIAPVYP